MLPKPTSLNSLNCARSCGRPRTLIGPSKWTFNGRSRPPGLVYAEGEYEDAPNAMSGAADAEDKTDKHPVTPRVPTPARELYGLMLLEHARKDDTRRSLEAEQVFRKHSAKCSIASYIRQIG